MKLLNTIFFCLQQTPQQHNFHTTFRQSEVVFPVKTKSAYVDNGETVSTEYSRISASSNGTILSSANIHNCSS